MTRIVEIPLSTQTAKIKPNAPDTVKITVIVDGVRHHLEVPVPKELRDDQYALLAYLHDYGERFDFS